MQKDWPKYDNTRTRSCRKGTWPCGKRNVKQKRSSTSTQPCRNHHSSTRPCGLANTPVLYSKPPKKPRIRHDRVMHTSRWNSPELWAQKCLLYNAAILLRNSEWRPINLHPRFLCYSADISIARSWRGLYGVSGCLHKVLCEYKCFRHKSSSIWH